MKLPVCNFSLQTTALHNLHLRFPGRFRPSQGTSNYVKHFRKWLSATSATPDLNLLVPEIEGDIKFYQGELGAIFDDEGVVATFGDSHDPRKALEDDFVVYDQSHWGRIKASGNGAQRFLHGQSTNDFERLKPGEGCDTVFITATGRTIDLAACHVTKGGVIVILSPGMSETILERLDKYIFPGDEVEITDISAKCSLMSIWGEKSELIAEELGIVELKDSLHRSCTVKMFSGSPVIVSKGSAIGQQGYSFLADESVAGDLYAALIGKGGVPVGADVWDSLRIEEGIPIPGKELTDKSNPLEAGLYHAISLNKGCYIGQETLAKVYRNQGVKQELWALEVEDKVSLGDPIVSSEGRRLGNVTSVGTTLSGEILALAYLRCRGKDGRMSLEGARVDVGGISGSVVASKFALRDFVDGVGAPILEVGDQNSAVNPDTEDVNNEEAAKQERIRQMEARVAEFMAQQKNTKLNE